MTEIGDKGVFRTVNGRTVFVPARRPEVGEKCILYPVAGGYVAVPLTAPEVGDTVLLEPVNGRYVAVPTYRCRAGVNRIYYSATETSITFWCPNPGTINPDGNIWWFVYGYNSTHGKGNDDEPYDEVLEYLPSGDYVKPITVPISGPGVYSLMTEKYIDCNDTYTELFCFGLVVLPLVKSATVMHPDEFYHQLRPQVSYGSISWEEVDISEAPEDARYIGYDNFHQAWTYQYIQHVLGTTVSLTNCFDLYYCAGADLHYRYIYNNPTRDFLVYTGAAPIRGLCGDRAVHGADPYNYWWQRIVFFETVGAATSIYLYKGSGSIFGPYASPIEVVSGLPAGVDYLNFGQNILCWVDTDKVVIAHLSPYEVLYTGPSQSGISRPRTDGDVVVWSSSGVGVQTWTAVGGREVLASGTDPDVDRGMIVWADGDDIWLKDGAASPTIIHTGAGTVATPAISNGTIAWSEMGPANEHWEPGYPSAGLWQVWYLRVALTYPQYMGIPPT